MAASYGDFIEDAYISPIRSVLIVDDDYPTIDELFLPDRDRRTKQWQNDKKSFQKVVKGLRDHKWLIDTHDGRNIDPKSDEKIAAHLHQSDLLILDYQLDGNDNNGDKCLSIVKELALNNHFNLVVIYTQHDKPSEVFQEAVLSLLTPCEHLVRFNLEKSSDSIECWELEKDEIGGKLIDSVGLNLYLSIRQDFDKCLQELNAPDGGRFHELVNLFKQKPTDIQISLTLVLMWVLHEKEAKFREKFSREASSVCEWSVDSKKSPWLRTDKLFLTVVSKQNEQNLPKALLSALKKWNPSPSRLIMSKILYELDDLGISVEEEAQDNKPLQAAWYKQLLDADDLAVKTEVNETIGRHWDGFMSQLDGGVTSFVQQLLEFENSGRASSNAIVNKRYNYPIRLTKNKVESKLFQNAYNCCQPLSGEHLTTGHIFKLSNSQYWVCMSPVCDLVPGRERKGRHNRLQNCMPFHAVQLYPVTAEKDIKRALSDATRGKHIFWKQSNDKVLTFSTVNPKGEGANPTWDEVFAEDGGCIKKDDCWILNIHRSSWATNSKNIQTSKEPWQVVGQLRYEYALNLLQKHGSALSRVGLGFVGLE